MFLQDVMIVNEGDKPKGKKEKRCCIDLGSSYFRKLIVDVETTGGKQSIRAAAEERMYVGWGEEVEHNSSISMETLDRAADLLAALIGDIGVDDNTRLTIVATNTLRIASNRIEARKCLEEKTGRRIDVLSERGEALLGFTGATSDLPAGAPVLLVDLGGTSTELSWGRAPTGSSFASLPLGTHTYHNIGAIPELIDEILVESNVPLGDSHLPGSDESHTIMLTGGTAVSLAAAWKQMNGEEYDYRAPVEFSILEFDELYEWIFEHYLSGRERELALPPERIRLFSQGTAMTKTFLLALRADRMTITARDLRWGVVLGDGITEWGYLADEQESPDSR
jgi:exopolyphosphatase/guanosine-5'-triphosphate,3'-diphosphate pyrophosphatase